MGFVYQIRQPALDRIVALKILSPELSRDPAFAERFAREARVLGKLNHPNIVTVYESGESGGFFYLVMEYVDGVNLRQAMRAGRFTPQQALAVVPGICDALQAAHAQGVWYRDIKPENILLDAQGNVKIVDFGIARLVGDPRRDFTLTRTGAALGSAAYMAPEQHEKPHDVDHRADIYSLGVVIYEMLTGELPLGRFPAPSAKSAVDARIDEIVFRTLEKEREMRQQSATEVKTDFTTAARYASKPVAPKMAVQRFPSTWLAALATLVSILATWISFEKSPYGDNRTAVSIGVGRPWISTANWPDPGETTRNWGGPGTGTFLLAASFLWVVWLIYKKRSSQAMDVMLVGENGRVSASRFVLYLIATCSFSLCAGFMIYAVKISLFPAISYPSQPLLAIYISCLLAGIIWAVVRAIDAPNRHLLGIDNPKPTLMQPPLEQLEKQSTSIQPTIILHAILFALVAVIFVIVLPRFAEMFREMGVPQSFFPTINNINIVNLSLPVLFGIDIGLCFLARKMGGRRGLRLWSVTVILLMVAAIGATSGVQYMRLKNVIDTFGGPASAANSNRAAEEERWVAETYREAQGQLEALKRKFPDFSTPQGAVIAYQVGLETQNSGAVLAAIPKSVVQSAVSPSNYVEELIAAHQVLKNPSKGVAILTYVNILDPVPEIGTMDRYSQKRILGRDPGVTVVVQFKLSYLGGTMTSTETCVQEGKEWRVIPDAEPTAMKPHVNQTSTDVESWSYTLRHLDATKLAAEMKAKPQAGVTTKVEAGVVTLTGRADAVRPLATMLRVMDQPEVKDPLQLPFFNMPPDFFSRLAIPGLMMGAEFKDSQFEPAFFATLKSNGVTAPQLARALRAHVLELEKATFVNTGTPFESIKNTPGASTYYDGTIPCADQPDKPLTFRIRRTTQQFGTTPDIAGFAPWLIEEAKLQSKEPLATPTQAASELEGAESVATTIEQDAALLAATKGKVWKSGVLDFRRENGHQFKSILTLEFAPFAGNRKNPPDASVKVLSTSPPVKDGPITLSVGIGDADFKDVRLTEKDGVRTIKITQAIEAVDHPTKKTERVLNDYRSMSFGYVLTADTLTLKGFPTEEINWGSMGFIAPTRDIVFKLQP